MNTATRPGFGMRPGEIDTEATEAAIPERSRVDLAAERDEAGIDELMSSLDDELIGLREVKTRIREVAALLLVDRVRQRFGVSSTRPNLHMCFTGNPGTGKTTVAMRMAGLLHRIGYLERGHLVAVTRDDLVGQYVGHTAPKTKEVLKRAMGGVLFIDEAYYLYRAENERDYGQESIEILLQVMENQREDVVVILAGYGDRMAEFFHSNPGMSSRVAHHIEFDDYDLGELESIAGLMSEQDGYRIGGEAAEVFRELLDEQRARPRFANARTVRNVLERARLRHASRLVDTLDDCGLDDLVRLEPVDFKS
ncbi:AAA family ATPase [Saccharopolyspora dendranthemae]|uniref:Putative Rubsico expression protein CbbX n=1 Tax=Saccharopolyspora dendranthemae TaxID=1181886 RepID=A0A561V912_9PSEU|nr:AAA family ATPase [Saccharopolyspora dendranthemae]TWG08099.1 putative Rubsico expression protein CbbX [Saccharopolyspora dendranthemae]